MHRYWSVWNFVMFSLFYAGVLPKTERVLAAVYCSSVVSAAAGGFLVYVTPRVLRVPHPITPYRFFGRSVRALTRRVLFEAAEPAAVEQVTPRMLKLIDLIYHQLPVAYMVSRHSPPARFASCDFVLGVALAYFVVVYPLSGATLEQLYTVRSWKLVAFTLATLLVLSRDTRAAMAAAVAPLFHNFS